MRAEEVWLEKLEGRSERRPIWKNCSLSRTRHPPGSALPRLITLPPSGQKLSLIDLNVEDILSLHISVLKTSARVNCKSSYFATNVRENKKLEK